MCFLTEPCKHTFLNLIVSMKKLSCVWCRRHLVGLRVACKVRYMFEVTYMLSNTCGGSTAMQGFDSAVSV